MKKTLSLLLALVMVIGLFPVFADEAKVLTAEEAGAILQGYGAIKGGSDGDLMIDKELKRQDAVVILTRLMGKETDALATQAAPSFEDITIDYYKPFLAFAEANKWVEGKKEKTFGFNDVTTVKEFAAMLLRALGHDTTGENYPKVMELAKELKLFNGATVEENAPIVRGIAFILMNNTLETAPKGEDKALVYKLGYKEEPKPQGFVVTEAKAAGRKAIDVVFSKAVKETTLFNIGVKEGPKSLNIDNKIVSEDGMTVRLILEKAAKQDALYNLTVASVKTVDGKETVEKFEAKVSMTDQVRPEVKGVEVLNPKTFVVKTSEPIDMPTMASFSSLKNFKIDGKELTVKVMNAYKDELIVEFYNAVKPGEYKIEVSGLKDFDGLIAKTEEFDFTVVEDKEAPVVTSAKMITVQALELTFNEPVKTKGAFKVNGHNIAPSKITIDQDDQKVVYLELTKDLDLGAVTEISVQHKGQRDAMNNTVKDWTKFTFKVEDDTEVPVVEGVSVNGTTVYVRFNKPMYAAGKYDVKNAQGKVVLTGDASVNGSWANDRSLFVFTVSKFKDENSDDFTLVLEGFRDGTVRGNRLPSTELPFASKDLKKPEAIKKYVFGQKEGYVYAHIFFNEDMDVKTLEDPKNYTFEAFEYNGKTYTNYRADGDLAALTFTVRNGSKEVILEADDKKITGFGKIWVHGQKDLAGNLIDRTDLEIRGNVKTQKIDKAELMRGEGDEGYVIGVTFVDGITSIDGQVFELVDNGDNSVSKLTKFKHDENDSYAVFKVESPNMVSNAATTIDPVTKRPTATTLKLKLVNGKNAMSVYGEEANEIDKDTNVAVVIDDKVAPKLTQEAMEGTIKVDKGTKTIIGVDADNKRIFDDKIDDTKEAIISITGADGFNTNASVNADGYTITSDTAMPEGVYTVHVNKVQDSKENKLEFVSFRVTVGNEKANFVISPLTVAAAKVTEILVKFDDNINVVGTIPNGDVTVDVNGTNENAKVNGVVKEGTNGIKITLNAPGHTFAADGTTIKVSLKPGHVFDSTGYPLTFGETESPVYKAAQIVKIVSANKTASSDGKIVVEFDRELTKANNAVAGITVKVDGTPEAKYTEASVDAGNAKLLNIKSTLGNDISLADGAKIVVELGAGHNINDKDYAGVVLMQPQVSPEFVVK